MIARLSHHTVLVLDQALAREFYVNKLGFTATADVEMGSFRWLTVAPPEQPDVSFILMPLDVYCSSGPGSAPEPELYETMARLVKAGKMPTGVLFTADCRAAYAELLARGVTFAREPVDQFYGVEALLEDPFGNWYSMTQPKTAS